MKTNDERRASAHYFGVESWQTRHDACLRIQREIATSLADRDRLPTTSHRYSNLNEQILQKLKILGKQIDVLKEDLQHTQDKSITSGERSRRQGLIQDLFRLEQELRFSLSQSSITKTQRKEERQRKELLTSDGGGVADLGDIQWGGAPKQSTISNYGATESSSAAINHSSRDQDPRSPSTHQVFDKILSEQDQGLDNLHNVVVRSRIAAQNIHSEVGVQNEIIDGLDDDIERTTQHLLSTTQRVRTVDRTSAGVWKYWLVIGILFIAIVIVIAV